MIFDKEKLIKMFAILIGLVLLIWGATLFIKSSSQSLSDYAVQNPEQQGSVASNEGDDGAGDGMGDVEGSGDTDSDSKNANDNDMTENLQNITGTSPVPALVGLSLNSNSMEAQRTTYAEGFYYEPLSENLQRFITGVSYPKSEDGEKTPEVSFDDLRYIHIIHYDFDGNPAEGELICNKDIAQDLVEIFHKLYRNEYSIAKVRLVDEYDGDDTASMEDNNTSCFNYRTVDEKKKLSKHAYGRAIDINPLYNPYITYNKDGTTNVSPKNATDYEDRSRNFPYKIDETDLCYKLFVEHGFTWGGNWNTSKDYQHFQK